MRNYFWSLFSCIQTEFRDLQSIQSEYRKIRAKNASLFEYFSRSDYHCYKSKNLIKPILNIWKVLNILLWIKYLIFQSHFKHNYVIIIYDRYNKFKKRRLTWIILTGKKIIDILISKLFIAVRTSLAKI